MSCSKALHLPKVTSVMRPMDYTRLPGLNCCCKGMRKDLVKERVRLVWQEKVPAPGADGLWVRFFAIA